jgi:hypothetical protein
METCVLFYCLGTTDRKETELDSRGRHSDSRTAAPCDGRPNPVWTWILVCVNTFWKAIGVYFHMHQTSSPYLIGAGRNLHFSEETFSANGAATPYFGPLVSC